MNKSNRPVQGLAEITLRVHDLDAMRRFYEEVIGLEVLQACDALILTMNSFPACIQAVAKLQGDDGHDE